MKSYIKSIILLERSNDKRFIELNRGLNIITGQSKSGKSALIEIIDYCLGSSQPTIPKGVITEFTYIYSILIEVNDTVLLIGRKRFNEDGRKFMYIRYLNKHYQTCDINLELFNEEHKLRISDAKIEIGNAFGIKITNSSTSIDDNIKGKPSIRDMVSFMFQHQNLIANKFALFYRFENSKKRDRVIKLLPVFTGWVDQNFYSLIYELDELKKEKKRLEKNNKIYDRTINTYKDNLLNSIGNYYMILGEKFNQESHTLESLLELRKRLPSNPKVSYINNELEKGYYLKKEELEEIRARKHEKEIKIRNLVESEKYGNTYKQNLEMLNSKQEQIAPHETNYDCPICGKEQAEITEKAAEVVQAKEWLNKELQGLIKYNSGFEEEIHILKNEMKIINKEIMAKEKEIDEIESNFEEIKNKKYLDSQIQYAKARLDIECDLIEKQLSGLEDKDIEDIKSEIKHIERLIDGYDLDSFLKEAQYLINKNMNRIINNLDFEEEFLPANLRFNLDNFDLYHHDKVTNEKIYLSEMGSGANWLACHIGLFMSLLNFFSKQEGGTIPSIMFFDQPSQVYFPDVFDEKKTKDIKAVQDIYIAILRELDFIFEDTGFYPQVIITDHVDNLSLGNYEFNDYVRKRWWDEKFI